VFFRASENNRLPPIKAARSVFSLPLFDGSELPLLKSTFFWRFDSNKFLYKTGAYIKLSDWHAGCKYLGKGN
jgi:hypothetical protein